MGYDLSEKEFDHKLKFKDNLPFTAQSLIRMAMIEHNRHEGYQFIEKEEEKWVLPAEQEPKHEALFLVQRNDDQFEMSNV